MLQRVPQFSVYPSHCRRKLSRAPQAGLCGGMLAEPKPRHANVEMRHGDIGCKLDGSRATPRGSGVITQSPMDSAKQKPRFRVAWSEFAGAFCINPRVCEVTPRHSVARPLFVSHERRRCGQTN
jgi:hypothetical protein